MQTPKNFNIYKAIIMLGIGSLLISSQAHAAPVEPIVKGGYSNSSCRDISIKTDMSDLSAKITCRGNPKVRTYRIDCGNGESFLLEGGKRFVSQTCQYKDNTKEYKAQCFVSRSVTDIVEKVTKTTLNCSENFSFNPEIERKRMEEKNKIQESDSFIIVDDEYFRQKKLAEKKLAEKKLAEKKLAEKKISYKTIQKKTLDHKNIQRLQDIFNRYNKDKSRLLKLKTKDNTYGLNDIMRYPDFLPRTGTPKAFYKRKVEKLRKIVELDLPKNVGKLAGNYKNDVNFWKQAVVKEDRNREAYIVIPSNGLVVPLNTIPFSTEYYKNMRYGNYVDINTYLTDGVATYAGTEITKFGEVGNPIIYGHSSYWKRKEGRYKTHFQMIIGLETKSEIWVYARQENNTYKRFKYLVEKSYNTDEKDFETLSPGKGRNLTLMTCTPIGSSHGRWIVKAKYIDEEKMALNNKIYGLNLDSKDKNAINMFINGLNILTNTKQKENILHKFIAINALTGNNGMNSYIDYYKNILAMNFFK